MLRHGSCLSHVTEVKGISSSLIARATCFAACEVSLNAKRGAMIIKYWRPSIILCYHRLGNEDLGGPSLLTTSPENFLSHLTLLRKLSYQFVPLSDFDARLPGTCAITFDDGYLDNLTLLAPVLRQQHIPATIFISSHYVESGDRFPPDLVCDDDTPSSSSALSREVRLNTLVSMPKHEFLLRLKKLNSLDSGCSDGRPLTLAQLKELSEVEGVEIGPHTMTHRSMASLGDDELMEEIKGSAEFLTRNGITSVRFFALPFGQGPHVDPRVSDTVKGMGYIPLTTFPITPLSSDRCLEGQLGLPRLSVGPWSAKRFGINLHLMLLGSLMPSLWLKLLEQRRRLLARWASRR